MLWSPVNAGPINARCQVVTIHDVFSIEFPRWVGRKFHLWYAFLLPRLAYSARHILTVSEYSRSRIVEVLKVPESKVSVAYPGVDALFTIAEPARVAGVRNKYNLPEEFILTLGSLEPRKNLHRVVDAWPQPVLEIERSYVPLYSPYPIEEAPGQGRGDARKSLATRIPVLRDRERGVGFAVCQRVIEVGVVSGGVQEVAW